MTSRRPTDLLPTPTVDYADRARPPDAGHRSAFTTGEIVAGRYRVCRFLGSGGFGHVYEAQDLELGQRVALKTVRLELAEEPRVIEGLRSEVRLSRQVTHRNVCRIFDFCRHVTADGKPVFFISMEFLEGEPLSRVVSAGGLGRPERLAILRQVASGLHAVHRAGIVHRDVKAANVLLVDEDERRRRRAVLCDFGLATLFSHRDEGGSGGGTPAYMAPEQKNGVATVRSDVYSFAVLWHEVLSGHRPRRRGDRVELDPRLDSRTRRLMSRCLRASPDERPRSMATLTAELSAPGSRSLHWRRIAAALVLALLMAAVPTLGLLERSTTPLLPVAQTPSAVEPRPSVVVLGFSGPGGEDAWLGTALPDMLTAQLIAGERLRVVPRSHVRTQCGSDTAKVGQPGRFGCLTGARWVIEGDWSYADQTPGDAIRLAARVVDSQQGRVLTELAQDGSMDDLPAMVTQVANRLRTALDAGEVSPAELAVLRGTYPDSFEALRLYTRGKRAWEEGRLIEAHGLLIDAIAAEPSFPLSRSALADVLAELGYRRRAAETAREALTLARDFPRRERLTILARVQELEGSLEEAAETYRSLWTVFPDEAEHGIRLARLEGEAGRPEEGLAVIEQLRTLPRVNRARLDLVASSLAGMLGDLKSQRSLAARTAAEAESLGFHSLVARAHLAEGDAAWRLGDLRGAAALYDEALRLFSQAGDRAGRALALKSRADLSALSGDFREAEADYRQALALLREMGAKERQARILFNLASTLHGLRRYREADRTEERSIDLFRAVGRDDMAVSALTNAAWRLITLGRISEAEDRAHQAVVLAQPLDRPQALEAARYNLALARLRAGAAGEAHSLLSTSVENLRRMHDPARLAKHLVLLAEAEIELDRPSRARQRLDEALRLTEGRDLPEDRVKARVQLARIERMEGRLPQALRQLEMARAGARDGWHELLVEREWVRLAEAEGDEGGARTHAERAAELAANSHDRQQALARLDLASIHLTGGRDDSARRLIAQADRLARDVEDVETVTALAEMKRRLARRTGRRAEPSPAAE